MELSPGDSCVSAWGKDMPVWCHRDRSSYGPPPRADNRECRPNSALWRSMELSPGDSSMYDEAGGDMVH